MTRPCHITDCTRPAAKQRLICHHHRHRIHHYGDPSISYRTLTYPDTIPPVVEHRLPDWGLTHTDRRTATQLLTQQGASAKEIANLIGVTERTIYRWRAQQRTTTKDHHRAT